MCAMELVTDPATKDPIPAETTTAILRTALENGVIAIPAGTYGNVVRLLPPLTIEDALLEDGLDVLEAAIGANMA